MLKKILLFVLGVIAVVLLAGLFAPSGFETEKFVVVNKSKSEVYEFIKYLKNQDKYSVWAKLDPNMTKTYSGEDATIGFVSKWEGNDKVGKGEQEIIEITEGERIEYEIRMSEPWENSSPSYIELDSISENQTKVKWGLSGEVSYPSNIMLLFFDMGENFGKDLQMGLQNLKSLLESQQTKVDSTELH